jgi:hypothetical protein
MNVKVLFRNYCSPEHEKRGAFEVAACVHRVPVVDELVNLEGEECLRRVAKVVHLPREGAGGAVVYLNPQSAEASW